MDYMGKKYRIPSREKVDENSPRVPLYVCMCGTPSAPSRHFIKKNELICDMIPSLMLVNGIDFRTTLSRKIRFLTVEHIPPRTAAQLSSSLTKIVNV